MIKLLFNLLFYYGFIIGVILGETTLDLAKNFNETLLLQRLHKNKLQAGVFFKKVNHTAMFTRRQLRDNHPTSLPGVAFASYMDYDVTDIWWSGERSTGPIPVSFIPTPKDHHVSEDYVAEPFPPGYTATEAESTRIEDLTAKITKTPKTTDFDIPEEPTGTWFPDIPLQEIKTTTQSTTKSVYTHIDVSLPYTNVHPNISNVVKKWLAEKKKTEVPEFSTDFPGKWDPWKMSTLTFEASTQSDTTLSIEPLTFPTRRRFTSSPTIKRQGLEVQQEMGRDPTETTQADPNDTTASPATTEFRMATATPPPDTFTYTPSISKPAGGPLLLEDEMGFPKVVGDPKLPQNVHVTVVNGELHAIDKNQPTNLFTETTAGDAFFGFFSEDPSGDPYKEALYAEMDKLKEGYMCMFLIRLTKLVATKNSKHVRRVLMHFENARQSLANKGRFSYFGQPLQTVVFKIGIIVAETPMDALQSYSQMVHNSILHRKITMPPDINKIIDDYDALFDENEAQELFDVLKEFEFHPNANMSDYTIAEELLERFLAPLRRMSWNQKSGLIRAINNALSSRFPDMPLVGGLSGRRFEGDYDDLRKMEIKRLRYDPEVQRPSTQPKPKSRRRRPQLLKPILPEDINFHRKKKIQRGQIIQRRNLQRVTPRQPDFNYERVLRRNYYLPSDVKEEITTFSNQAQRRYSVIVPGSYTERLKNIGTRSVSSVGNDITENVVTVEIDNNDSPKRAKGINIIVNYDKNIELPSTQKQVFYTVNMQGHESESKENIQKVTTEIKLPIKYHQAVKSKFDLRRELKELFEEKETTRKLALQWKHLKNITSDSSSSDYSNQESDLKRNLINALSQTKDLDKSVKDSEKIID